MIMPSDILSCPLLTQSSLTAQMQVKAHMEHCVYSGGKLGKCMCNYSYVCVLIIVIVVLFWQESQVMT